MELTGFAVLAGRADDLLVEAFALLGEDVVAELVFFEEVHSNNLRFDI